jgi:hypothetical protein
MPETATAAVRASFPAAAPVLDHISWSGVTTYCACPRKFYYRYIERAPEEFVPASLAFGGAFHRAVELIHEARLHSPYQTRTQPPVRAGGYARMGRGRISTSR